MAIESNQLIKGSLSAIILKLLENNGRMYGYEITKTVRSVTNDSMKISEAALYPALHKLEEDGLLETTTEMVDGRMRKYYSLTRKGKKDTVSKVDALKQALESINLVLNSKPAYE